MQRCTDKDMFLSINQTVALIGDQLFGQFLDFSVGDHVTVSDGNPNIGSKENCLVW
jgi:hypothetical protein